MRMPPGSRWTSEDYQLIGADGRIQKGVPVPWRCLPIELESYLQEVESDLLHAANNAVELIRWRFGLPTPPSVISRRALFWSPNGTQWNRLATSGVVHLESAPSLHLKEPFKTGERGSDRLGRHRWVVKRTFAWLNRLRRLAVRYEPRRHPPRVPFSRLQSHLLERPSMRVLKGALNL
jgi:hypothetical protein